MTEHTWPWCAYCRCYGCPHTQGYQEDGWTSTGTTFTIITDAQRPATKAGPSQPSHSDRRLSDRADDGTPDASGPEGGGSA